MERRQFIARAGFALTSGVLAAGCDDRDLRTEESVASSGADLGEWAGVRRQFDLSPNKIHMSALLVATHPRSVSQAIEHYRRELDADPAVYVEAENSARKRDARAAAADYLGGGVDHVALTDSTTMGIALVYHGLLLDEGDEVLTTEHDYYATHEALRQAAHRTGATVRRFSLFEGVKEASEEQIVGRITRAITPQTRLLALTWVHSGTGLKLPMKQITEAVRNVNRDRDEADRVLVGLDGVHGFGVENVTADDLGCDFFMAGCHKWLFGPRGTGIVWARPDAWSRLRPMIPSFVDDESWNAWVNDAEPPGATTAARMTPGGFKAFEHQWAIADAFAFHREIGKDRIADRTHALARQLKEGLATMPHVTLITPRNEALSAGIVCFDVEGQSPSAVVGHLATRDIVATITPYAVTHARLTPSICNTPDEIDTVLREIRDLG